MILDDEFLTKGTYIINLKNKPRVTHILFRKEINRNKFMN